MSSFGSLAGDEESERMDAEALTTPDVIAGLQPKRLQTVIIFDGVLSHLKAAMVSYS
jgi:hypothetical protein